SNLFDLFTYGSTAPETGMFDDTPTTQPSRSAGGARNGQREGAHQRRGSSAEEPGEAEGSAVKAVCKVGAVEEYDDANPEEDMLDAVITNNAEVYEHESVVNSKRKIRADKKLTEQEADRLNERTVRFLRDQAKRAYFARHGGSGGETSRV